MAQPQKRSRATSPAQIARAPSLTANPLRFPHHCLTIRTMEFLIDILTLIALFSWLAVFPAVVDGVCEALGLK